nr:sigma-70 family RNA polymerase sigma factor [uncultured Gemmiger sp.]
MPLLDRNGQEKTLARAYHQYYHRLCAVAAAVLDGDRALAQDAVQEAWLRLNTPGVRERMDVSDPDRLRGLLLVTVRNAARNLRRGRREQTLPGEGWAALPDPAPGPAEQTEQAAAVAALRRGLRALPAADHDVLPLQYVQGFSAAETAAVLGISEEAVRQRAHRARNRLRKLLEQEGYDDRP